MVKVVQFSRDKWVAINNQGSTWELAKHLIGDNAKSILDKYLAGKATIFTADEQRKKDILSGILVNTGKQVKIVDNVVVTAKGNERN
jgi:hypothetical protein